MFPGDLGFFKDFNFLEDLKILKDLKIFNDLKIQRFLTISKFLKMKRLNYHASRKLYYSFTLSLVVITHPQFTKKVK